MIRPGGQDDPIRRRIQALGSAVSLPTVRKALGILEGEHPSGRRGNGYDNAGIRAYEPGDESRLIDWHSSARAGRPMIVEKERQMNSKVWLLLDVGREMTATCEGGEQALQVAINALLMFASLSLKRSDDVCLILADDSSIRRIPCKGGLDRFERVLEKALAGPRSHPRNLGALLRYVRGIDDPYSLIVLATDETALGEDDLGLIHQLARTHPMTVATVCVLNPFGPNRDFGSVVDAADGRTVPTFLRRKATQDDVMVHRGYLAEALRRELARNGSTLIRGASSKDMLDQFIRLLSRTLPATGMVPGGRGAGPGRAGALPVRARRSV